MHVAAKRKPIDDSPETAIADLSSFVPTELRELGDAQADIPRLAKEEQSVRLIERAVQSIPTRHELHLGDAREMEGVEPGSVHLILTSPPYWTLKEYRDNDSQLGHIEDYDQFLHELDKVWKHCFRALLPGGRLICVVGDVCLSRRENGGRHTVVPLHASIQEHCRRIGFDNLAPIIWHKIANVAYEVEGGSGFLGKPYEAERGDQERHRVYPDGAQTGRVSRSRHSDEDFKFDLGGKSPEMVPANLERSDGRFDEAPPCAISDGACRETNSHVQLRRGHGA